MRVAKLQNPLKHLAVYLISPSPNQNCFKNKSLFKDENFFLELFPAFHSQSFWAEKAQKGFPLQSGLGL